MEIEQDDDPWRASRTTIVGQTKSSFLFPFVHFTQSLTCPSKLSKVYPNQISPYKTPFKHHHLSPKKKILTVKNYLNLYKMESVGSSSTPPDDHHRISPTQPLAERIIRALRHRLRLIHRLDSTFFVLGATGNVYSVNISTMPSCTCPDRTTPCKHILFVLIRVLGLPLDDSCIWRKTLRPCQLNRLLSLPTSTEALAGATVREMFHQLFLQAGPSTSRPKVEVEDGTTCPVCLEEMGKLEKLVACGTCRNPIHEECLVAWKKSSRRRSASCVLCRARWRSERTDQEKYLNLSAYVSEDDMVEGQDSCSV